MSEHEDEGDRGQEARASGNSENKKNSGNSGGKQERDKKPKRSVFRNPLVRIGLVVIVLALIVGGILYWLHARQYESTDDAFIDTHIVQVAPQLAAQVTRIYVTDNQLVRAGQPLVDLNPADPQARIAQTIAQQAQAETQIAQARANEAAAAAQAQNAARDLARYRYLKRTSPLAVAQQQIDQAEAAAKSANAQRNAAEAQIRGAQAQITVLRAQLSQAQINLGYTHIVAPVDGTIAQRSVALGNYVTPGAQMMAIVPLQIWVTANFKETQLAHMRLRQPVTVSIDACPEADIRGHVDSVQRGAGQAFGILPPENATGNYVKVVQRVPVKIVLDRVPRDCVLGPGMSVEPTVKVR
ncbi:MAG TPA: HlyD family secretion protein [Rhizomicrobium sp.]|jgi:membrane fusion protein (multidrug efflux system)|nr:HlyD family secretion protein [Rhizomicrobium sp.]